MSNSSSMSIDKEAEKAGEWLHRFRMSHYSSAPVTNNDLKDLAVALMHEVKLLDMKLDALLKQTPAVEAKKKPRGLFKCDGNCGSCII